MKKYLEYKNEIQGFEDVIETVKTMEKIAASHIHLLKNEVRDLETYIQILEEIISRLLLFYAEENHPLLSPKVSGKNSIVIITGDKGLVGGLYHNSINLFLPKAKNYQSLISVGNKGESYLKEERIMVDKTFPNSSEVPKAEEITAITDYIFSEFERGEIKKVDIIYPQFISLSQSRPKLVQFLPFKFGLNRINPKKGLPAGESLGFPIFEPSRRKIFSRLLKKYIKVFFYEIITEAKLSEFSARTITTEQAAAKTEDLIRKLKVTYVKERRIIMAQKQIESFAIHQTI